MSDFNAVGEFHHKFGLRSVTAEGPKPGLADAELMAFRIKFLKEELKELEKAVKSEDLPEQADALVDLVYVALGTAHLLGLPWPYLFAAVHGANLKKRRAAADASDSKRGSSFDVVKPEGWQPPDIASILRKFGWKP